MPTPTTLITVLALADRLRELEAERAQSALEGLAHSGYTADLEREIAGCRAAYVGAAVIEIATLRAALSGPLNG